jgi:hypothetical protein
MRAFSSLFDGLVGMVLWYYLALKSRTGCKGNPAE